MIATMTAWPARPPPRLPSGACALCRGTGQFYGFRMISEAELPQCLRIMRRPVSQSPCREWRLLFIGHSPATVKTIKYHLAFQQVVSKHEFTRPSRFNLNMPTLLLVILLCMLSVNFAHAAGSKECSMFNITLDCDLSGWMKLIVGDIALAASLAVLLHYLAHRSNAKIEKNTQIINRNSVLIQKILTHQQDRMARRQAHTILSLKNQFSSLLLCIGIIHKSSHLTSNENPQIEAAPTYQKMLAEGSDMLKSTLSKLHDTLNLSVDVIESMLVDQIEQFLQVVEQNALHDHQNTKPCDCEHFKNIIMQLTKRLDNYSTPHEILK